MKQEDKDLLLRYLSMAMPYSLKMQDLHKVCLVELCGINWDGEKIRYYTYKHPSLTTILYSDLTIDEKLQFKPYLRPMSSITEEELVELNCLCYHNISVQDDMLCGYICGIEIDDVQNFLLRYHFDFMGLIPRDLAIAVTEENNPYNTAEE